MTDTLDRDELIGLLERLGGEDDAEALAAGREAHARVAGAGLSWGDLLVPDTAAQEPAEEPAQEPADESDGADEPDLAEAEDESPGEGDERNAESLALIGELLARKDISEELRAELEGYKSDIAEGEFVAADRRYLRAVHRRLKK